MKKTSVKLTAIPTAVLGFIQSNTETGITAYLNGLEIEHIYLMRDRFRVTTEKGQYRYDGDTDQEIVILA